MLVDSNIISNSGNICTEIGSTWAPAERQPGKLNFVNLQLRRNLIPVQALEPLVAMDERGQQRRVATGSLSHYGYHDGHFIFDLPTYYTGYWSSTQ
ncbi:MAG: hypothetical protein JXA78_17350 [Anaerolineales bacterium]|nr:hypothetical protein [Anaerolineales bacterium]